MQGEGWTAATPRGAESVGDDQLVAALARGDRDALAALYDRHARLLLALAIRILRERGQAEELLHDVFLEAWHHAREFDPARGSVRAWLVTRMRSRALDRRAARSRQARLAEQAALDAAGASGAVAGAGVTPADAGGALDAERVRQQVTRLPAELVAVLELAYFDGLSSTEIAARLAIPVGTVKSRTARALALLREQLGPGADAEAGRQPKAEDLP